MVANIKPANIKSSTESIECSIPMGSDDSSIKKAIPFSLKAGSLEHSSSSFTLNSDAMKEPSSSDHLDSISVKNALLKGGIGASLTFRKLAVLFSSLFMLRATLSEFQKNRIETKFQERLNTNIHKAKTEANNYFSQILADTKSELNEKLLSTKDEHYILASKNATTLWGPFQSVFDNMNSQAMTQNEELEFLRNATNDYIHEAMQNHGNTEEALLNSSHSIAGLSAMVNASSDAIHSDVITIRDTAVHGFQQKHDKAMEYQAQAAEYQASFEAAITRITNLKDSISAQIESTCNNIRSQADKGLGVRGEILEGPVNMCNGIEEAINNDNNAGRKLTQNIKNSLSGLNHQNIDQLYTLFEEISHLSSSLRAAINGEMNINQSEPKKRQLSEPNTPLTGDSSVEEFSSTMDAQVSLITQGLEELKGNTTEVELMMQDSINSALSSLNISESLLNELISNTGKNSTDPALLANTTDIMSVAELLDQVKHEQRAASNYDIEYKKTVVNEAVESMNKKFLNLTESLRPKLEKAATEDLKTLQKAADEIFKKPLFIIDTLQAILAGIVVLSLLYNATKNPQSESKLRACLKCLPLINPKFRQSDHPARYPVESTIAEHFQYKPSKPKRKLAQGLALAAIKSIFTPQVIFPIVTLLALKYYEHAAKGMDLNTLFPVGQESSTDLALKDFGADIQQAHIENQAIMNNASQQLQQAFFNQDQYHENAKLEIEEARLSNPSIEQGVSFLEETALLDQFIDITSGRAFLDEPVNPHSQTEQSSSINFENYNMTADDLLSEQNIGTLFEEVVKEETDKAREEAQNNGHSKNNDFTVGVTFVITSVLSALFIEGGKHVPLEKLQEMDFLKQNFFTWFQRDEIVRPFADAIISAAQIGRYFEGVDTRGYWDLRKDKNDMIQDDNQV